MLHLQIWHPLMLSREKIFTFYTPFYTAATSPKEGCKLVYNSHMSGYDTELDAIIDRLNVITLNVVDTHMRLEKPETPEDKADLLISVEKLTGEILELLTTTKRYVWGESEE